MMRTCDANMASHCKEKKSSIDALKRKAKRRRCESEVPTAKWFVGQSKQGVSCGSATSMSGSGSKHSSEECVDTEELRLRKKQKRFREDEGERAERQDKKKRKEKFKEKNGRKETARGSESDFGKNKKDGIEGTKFVCKKDLQKLDLFQKLVGSRFRCLNEQFYTSSGDEMFKKMQNEPDLFQDVSAFYLISLK